MPVFKIHHITKYQYDKPIRESVNEIKIYPYKSADQETLSHELNISHHPTILNFDDYWQNKVGIFNLLALHNELVIESKLMLRTTAAEEVRVNFDAGFDSLQKDVADNLKLIELTEPSLIRNKEAMNDIIDQITFNTTAIAAIAQNCNQFIYSNFKYIKGITNIETTVDEILQHRSGVCQDFAHLMLEILRSLKIPCRYISGYICPNKKGARGEGATHAWVEVYIPNYGWAGIDPTNNIWVTNNHVKLAVGRNFNDCTPAKGTFKGPAHQQLSVFVGVSYEDGNIFEEVNNVKMHVHEQDYKEELVDDSLATQQQQQ